MRTSRDSGLRNVLLIALGGAALLASAARFSATPAPVAAVSEQEGLAALETARAGLQR